MAPRVEPGTEHTQSGAEGSQAGPGSAGSGPAGSGPAGSLWEKLVWSPAERSPAIRTHLKIPKLATRVLLCRSASVPLTGSIRRRSALY